MLSTHIQRGKPLACFPSTFLSRTFFNKKLYLFIWQRCCTVWPYFISVKYFSSLLTNNVICISYVVYWGSFTIDLWSSHYLNVFYKYFLDTENQSINQVLSPQWQFAAMDLCSLFLTLLVLSDKLRFIHPLILFSPLVLLATSLLSAFNFYHQYRIYNTVVSFSERIFSTPKAYWTYKASNHIVYRPIITEWVM